MTTTGCIICRVKSVRAPSVSAGAQSVALAVLADVVVRSKEVILSELCGVHVGALRDVEEHFRKVFP